MNKKYDAVVIGGGVAGYYCARTLKNGGKSVALIEKELVGGTALITGALPVKKILDSFKNDEKDKEKIQNIREELLNNWDLELDNLKNKIQLNLLEIGVDIYYGDGKFLDSKRYKINEKVLEAEYFIIATGTQPKSTIDIKIDKRNIISHKEVTNLKDIPKKVTILGGNVEGVELAALYIELGIDVTIIEMEEHILPENDRDLVDPIENYLKLKGVKIIKGIKAEKVEYIDKDINIILENGQKIFCNKAINTLFREPSFPKGIENTKIRIEPNRILVKENLKTHEKNIFAIGDINGILGMGHAAIQQGLSVAYYILNDVGIDIDYKILPRAIFTIPEMAGVGRQECELKENNISYKVGKYCFQDTWRGWSNKEEGFVKVLMDKNNVLLGIWMVGKNVSEYIGLLAILIKERKTAEDILSNLIIHPSLNEAILEAVIDGKEKVIE